MDRKMPSFRFVDDAGWGRDSSGSTSTTIHDVFLMSSMCAFARSLARSLGPWLDMGIIEIKVNVKNLIRWTIFIDNLFTDYWYFTRHRAHIEKETEPSQRRAMEVLRASIQLNGNFYLRVILFFSSLSPLLVCSYFFVRSFDLCAVFLCQRCHRT